MTTTLLPPDTSTAALPSATPVSGSTVVPSAAPVAAPAAPAVRAPSPKYVPTSLALDDMFRIAKGLAGGGLTSDNPAQLLAKILFGQEIGLGPMQSIQSVHLIEGKPTLDASLIAAQIKCSGRYDFKVIKLDDDGCIISFFEDGVAVGTSEFSREDARKAELLGKNTWKKYFRNMVFSRALTNGSTWYAAGALKSKVYTPEELGGEVDIDSEGRMTVVETGRGNKVDVATGEVLSSTPPPIPPAPQAPVTVAVTPTPEPVSAPVVSSPDAVAVPSPVVAEVAVADVAAQAAPVEAQRAPIESVGETAIVATTVEQAAPEAETPYAAKAKARIMAVVSENAIPQVVVKALLRKYGAAKLSELVAKPTDVLHDFEFDLAQAAMSRAKSNSAAPTAHAPAQGSADESESAPTGTRARKIGMPVHLQP